MACRTCNKLQKHQPIEFKDGAKVIYRADGAYIYREVSKYRATLVKLDYCPKCNKQIIPY